MSEEAPEIIRKGWVALGDGRSLEDVADASPNVSTNRVYRLFLDDRSCVFAKVASYGSFIHFRQDHQRIDRWIDLLAGGRFESFLAPVLSRDGDVFTYRDGREWVVFYGEVDRRGFLPRRLEDGQVDALGGEIAALHDESARCAKSLDATWKTMGSDLAALYDAAADPRWRADRGFTRAQAALVQRHCDTFFQNAEHLGYHGFEKIPVLLDWNIGNFSVETGEAGLRLYSRWDYDWFRLEPRILDFYSLSRVVRQSGDETRFSYTPDVFLEPRFQRFLLAYHEVSPLSTQEVRFLREAYRFFILNYVLHVGEHFFQWSVAPRLQNEALEFYLPAADALSLETLVDLIS
ncbi:hypothetical protein MK489_22665 [Myxococcota bacterium]|nr:hypothetical protein [Myxococcota bacterium]